VESVVGQQHFTMLGLPPGDYFVLTVPRMPVRAGSTGSSAPTRFGAAYTKGVLCGLSVDCTDHSLVPVHVVAQVDTANIDPGDWYAPEGAYAFVPDGGPPRLTLAAPPATFTSSEAAAIDEGQMGTGGRYVQSRQGCPINVACVWFNAGHLGQNAAYFTGDAGTNSDTQSCAFYVVGSDAAGWRPFDWRCRTAPAAFPARGSTGNVALGMGETGCVNVHSAPAKSAKVVACLAGGTNVRLDDGPVYVGASNPPSTLDVWWHIAGRGWMVHQYLRSG
jgi:hypothetical protein